MNEIMYKAADYLRLSKEDGDFSFSPSKKESNSISSQRRLIQDYVAKMPDVELVAEFVDDGYTGTNFDRPQFQAMMQAIERGEVNCIIVKDLSRFGREYIDAGQYIEKLFPRKGIRFIAINDHYDSANSTASDNLIVPFKNLINDSYSRDISIKVRTNLESKRQRGEFIANFAVYGYMRDPKDKSHLLVDEYAAQIVRDIFRMKIDGMSPAKIAEKLNQSGIKAPSDYKRANGSRYQSGFKTHRRTEWSAVTITRILTNEVYCGALIQGRRTTPNYKVKKTVVKHESEWARVENAHEAIIDYAVFHVVQRLMNEDCRSFSGSEAVHPLAGRVFCGDCGAAAKRKVVSSAFGKYAYYSCPNSGQGKSCAKRTISEKELEAAVLGALQFQIGTIMDLEQALSQIDNTSWEKRQLHIIETEIDTQKELIEKNNAMKMNVYEDFREGLIDRGELALLKETYTQRIEQANQTLVQLHRQYNEIQSGTDQKQSWFQQFRKYRNITELSRPLIVNMVDKILLFPDKTIRLVMRHEDQIKSVREFLAAQTQKQEAI